MRSPGADFKINTLSVLEGMKDKTDDFGKALEMIRREMQIELRELENTVK